MATALPAVAGVFSPTQCRQTAQAIAEMQQPSGAIPWFPGGQLDPWDHIEAAMALTATGRHEEATAAFDWSRRTQRDDGSWPMLLRGELVENHDADSNFCAYLAVGVWHQYLVTGRRDWAEPLWPAVRAAIEFVLGLQAPGGEIYWARGAGGVAGEALLTGSSSIHHSLRCAISLAELVGDRQPDWEVALYQLGHALRNHLQAFAPKPEFAMDWYYPILGGALRGAAADDRIQQRWDDFVVQGLGIRCVDHQPWVTGAETCELVLTLDAMGCPARAAALFASMQHLRDGDGAYWTGLVYRDGKRWPLEKNSWTAASVILAADALSRTTPGSGIFRDAALPPAQLGTDDCAEHCYASGSPV